MFQWHCASTVVVTLIVAGVGKAGGGTINVADYFPMTIGPALNYEITGDITGTATIEASTTIGIHQTIATIFSQPTDIPEDTGERIYFSITEQGLNQHREDFILSQEFNQWNAAMNLAPRMVEIGQTYDYSGAYFGQDDEDQWTGETTGSIEIIGFESVDTPAGTFSNALKVTINTAFTEEENDQSWTGDGSAVKHWWFVEGLGRVRLDRDFEEEYSYGDSESASFSFKLTSVDPGNPADLNNDGLVNALDVDLLAAMVRDSVSHPTLNLDGVGGDVPDNSDFDFYITDDSMLGTGHGDFDLNLVVNFDDFVILTNSFGMAGTGWAMGNANTDDVTNFDDFVLLTNNFGMSFASTPAPEANTLALCCILVGLVAARREMR